MKLVKYISKGITRWGRLKDRTKIEEFSTSPLVDNWKPQIVDVKDASKVEILPPTDNPTHVVGVALNFPGVAGEEIPYQEPLLFLKSPFSLVSITEPIVAPLETDLGFWGEVELACVIGKKTQNLSAISLKESILGFCLANDLTEENLHQRDHHLLRSKASFGFCPLGPYLDTAFSPERGRIWSKINGELTQQSDLQHMLFSVHECLEIITRRIPLLPGDVVLFGTPAGAGASQNTGLKIGDTMQIGIDGLGTISQNVVAPSVKTVAL